MKLTTTIKTTMVLLIAGLLACAASAGGAPTITVRENSTSVEIQQALDSLPDSGGEVILPPGTYAICEPIVLQRSHQTLRGSGPSTLLQLADHANCPVIVMGEPVNSPSRTVSNLRVADLAINGNRQEQENEIWQIPNGMSEIRNNGLTIQGVTDSVVEHVVASHCRSGGLVTTHYVRRLKVRDFIATDSEFDGLACYRTEESEFTGLFLHNNQAAGISFDLSVNNNLVRDAILADNDLGIFMRESRSNIFREINVDQSRSYGVFMAQAEQRTSTGWGPRAHTECTNNSFNELRVSNSGAAAFRVNDATCVDNVISSAHFRDNAKGGLSQVTPNLVMATILVQK
jgi:polygalacturonase